MALYAASPATYKQHNEAHLLDTLLDTHNSYRHGAYSPQSYSMEPPDREVSRNGSANDPPYLDWILRVARLEKDLEHCRGEKAEAEITVQHLAHLNSVKAASNTNGGSSKEVALLKRRLDEAKSEIRGLRTSLGEQFSIVRHHERIFLG